MEAFVYCWTDHKTNMLYVGSHKGTEDDGYVCSSKYMMEEYTKRPEDFTRQIVARGNVDDIRKLETKILQSVNAKKDKMFYNKHQNDGLFYNGWTGKTFTEEHRKKLSIAASKRIRTKEHIEKLHEGRRKSKNSEEHIRKIKENNTGKKHTEESRKKMSQSLKGRVSPNKGKIFGKQSDERKANTSDAMKKWWAERKAKQELTGG